MIPSQTEYTTPDNDREERIMNYIMILLLIEMAALIAVMTWIGIAFVGVV